MIFQDLLAKFDDKAIIKQVIKLYPDQKKNMEGYVRALDEIRNTQPKATDVSIVVSVVKAKDDPFYEKGDKDWVDICGVKGEEDRYAIGMTSWREWLSMPISEVSLKSFSELDILAHCLWEMTWYGYSNRRIQRRMGDLRRTVEKIREDEAKGQLTEGK